MTGFYVVVFILIALYTLYMGLQDGANAIATPIASGSMSRTETVAIATIFNIIAPITVFAMGNSSVAETISGAIISKDVIGTIDPKLGAVFVLSAMLSATLWLIFTSLIHIPSSSSHSMLGGIIGAAIPVYGFGALNGLNIFTKVVLVALLTPVIAMIISFLIMQFIKLIAKYLTSKFLKIIMVLQRVNVAILSASISINDVMKSMGVVMLLVLTAKYKMPFSNLGMVSIMSVIFAFGLIIGGKKMVYTIGNNIFQINRFDSFIVQLSSQSIVFTSSLIGLPVSTGQIMSSSIMGIGAASNMNLVKWGVSKKIILNWVLTLPLTIVFAAFVTLIMKKSIGA